MIPIEGGDEVRARSDVMLLRRGLSPARLKTFGMLASAAFALGAALIAARSANAMFDAWYWMPVVWGVVVLVGVLVGIVRNGLPDESRPPPRPSGDPTSDLTAAVTRWTGEHGLPIGTAPRARSLRSRRRSQARRSQ